MFKKIFLIILIISSFFIGDLAYSALEQCKTGQDLTSLEGCLSDSNVVQTGSGGNLKVSGGFKIVILNFIKNVGTILALAAIGFIAYGSMVLVSSGGNDEKIKKGKNIIKWALIGFTGLVAASGIIAIIINLIYGLN
nr:hypothetical protein [Candidatus Gracilibacteria bacterium]